jgi:hypothetical protein
VVGKIGVFIVVILRGKKKDVLVEEGNCSSLSKRFGI